MHKNKDCKFLTNSCRYCSFLLFHGVFPLIKNILVRKISCNVVKFSCLSILQEVGYYGFNRESLHPSVTMKLLKNHSTDSITLAVGQWYETLSACTDLVKLD